MSLLPSPSPRKYAHLYLLVHLLKSLAGLRGFFLAEANQVRPVMLELSMSCAGLSDSARGYASSVFLVLRQSSQLDHSWAFELKERIC